MSYETEPKTYTLRFEDFPGLEVTCAEPSLDELLALQELAGEAGSAEGTRKLFRAFAKHLTAWNVTRGGKPVAASYEGIMAQGAGFVRTITEGFIDAVNGVASPLRNGSSRGGSTQREPVETSIPMTPVSPGS